ncbi:MAG: hypothetical protein ABI882_20700, partial [Acidobacteriota bacterium]
GTNAILRSPPTLFRSHFGPASLEKHLHQARLLNARCELVHLERIGLDIDEPKDVAAFLKLEQASPVRRLLLEMDIGARLRSRIGL